MILYLHEWSHNGMKRIKALNPHLIVTILPDGCLHLVSRKNKNKKKDKTC